MRQRLPNRRPNEIIDFEHEGQRYTAAISRFANGRIAEVFLTSGKYGASVHLHATDSAILCSLALQHGVSEEDLRHTIRGPVGRALSLFPRTRPDGRAVIG
jgi:hypothetical protein